MKDFINVVFVFVLVNVDGGLIFVTDTPLQRVGRRLYKEETLTNQFDSPRELVYDSATRKLFFSYMDDEIQNSGRAYVNVITKEAKKIAGIQRNKATAVDTDTGDVYFGNDYGLYKYDPFNNTAHNLGLYNVNILQLIMRDNKLILIDANNHMVYQVFFNGNNVNAVKILNAKTVMELNVDNDRNIHYVTMCGVFCVASGHEIVKNKDLSIVYHFLVVDEKTYGITEDSIYDIDCNNGTASKIADMSFFPRSITAGDYGDLYYSMENKIFRLTPLNSYVVYNVHRKRNH